MKKVLLALILIILCSNFVYAADGYKIPENLLGAKMFADLTNKLFGKLEKGFASDNIDLDIGSKAIIKYYAKHLLLLFFMAGLFMQVDRIEDFTPYLIIKSFLYFLAAFWLIDHTDLIFKYSKELRIEAANILRSEGETTELVNFQKIVRQWNRTFSHKAVSKTTEIQLTIFYVQSMMIAFFSAAIMGVMMFLRLLKLKLLQIIAPLMMAGVGYKGTIGFTFKFIKSYVITDLFIVFMMAVTHFLLELNGKITPLFIIVQMLILTLIISKLASIGSKLFELSKKAGSKAIELIKNPSKIKKIPSKTLNKSRSFINKKAGGFNNLASFKGTRLEMRKSFRGIRHEINKKGKNINNIPSYLKDRKDKVVNLFKKFKGSE